MNDSRLRHRDLALLAERLAKRPGRTADGATDARRAAVAVMLRDRDGTLELLLIKRAEFESDPWSGHVALPGGRHEPGDATLEETMVRETREEIAIDLRRHGIVLGTLDEVHPRTPVLPPVVVRPFVVAVDADIQPVPSAEVADVFWVAVDTLREPSSWQTVAIPVRGVDRTVRSYRHGDHLVWGLTERVLHDFVRILDREQEPTA